MPMLLQLLTALQASLPLQTDRVGHPGEIPWGDEHPILGLRDVLWGAPRIFELT